MKRLKTIVATLIILIIAWCSLIVVSALPEEINEKLNGAVALYIGSPKAFANNTEKNIDNSNPDVVPIVKNGRTLVPLRFISENYNATVEWDKQTSTINIIYNNNKVVLQTGNTRMLVNDAAITLDVAPEVINGRTLIPLRRLAEDVLGKKVFYQDGLIIISDKENLLDITNERYLINEIIEKFDSSKEVLYPFLRDEKYGYINRTGKVIIQPKFIEAKRFYENRAAVIMKDKKGDEKWGIIDNKGNALVEPVYDKIENYSDGVARVWLDGKYGYVDTEGKLVIKPKFSWAGEFHEGFAVVRDTENGPGYPQGLFGYIDKKGNWVIEPKFDWAYDFSEGLAPVQIGDRCGYINNKGELVIKPQFVMADEFSEGLAFVMLPDNEEVNWGYIDKNGNLVNRSKEKHIFDTEGKYQEGLAPVFIAKFEGEQWTEGTWGYIDRTGKFTIKPQYGYAGCFCEGFAIVNEDDKIYFIDKFENKLGNLVVSDVEDFRDGLAYVSINNERKYIDRKGNIIEIKSEGE